MVQANTRAKRKILKIVDSMNDLQREVSRLVQINPACNWKSKDRTLVLFNGDRVLFVVADTHDQVTMAICGKEFSFVDIAPASWVLESQATINYIQSRVRG